MKRRVATAGGPVWTWVLRVTPKVDNKFTYRGRVWVSEDDDAVVRIQGEPAKSPSWWINRASFESTLCDAETCGCRRRTSRQATCGSVARRR